MQLFKELTGSSEKFSWCLLLFWFTTQVCNRMRYWERNEHPSLFFLLRTNGPKDKVISALPLLLLQGRATQGLCWVSSALGRGYQWLLYFWAPPACQNCPVWKTAAARLCFWRSRSWDNGARWQLVDSPIPPCAFAHGEAFSGPGMSEAEQRQQIPSF